jgi:hypothetical protein
VCSGGAGEETAKKWSVPWGGPFGVAYDRQYSMDIAPKVFWRSGPHLLVDVGDEETWEVCNGWLKAQSKRKHWIRGRRGVKRVRVWRDRRSRAEGLRMKARAERTRGHGCVDTDVTME